MARENNVYYKELSRDIIGCAFRVHTRLGSALPEQCYQAALVLELANCGIHSNTERHFNVHYDEVTVGKFRCDIIVEDKIILELKSDDKIRDNHLSQLLTYLRVTRYKVGYVLNFGAKSLQFKRLIL